MQVNIYTIIWYSIHYFTPFYSIPKKILKKSKLCKKVLEKITSK